MKLSFILIVFLFCVFSIASNAQVAPKFSFKTSICEGEIPPALPTTSDNGINGVWTPASINPLKSEYYTFKESVSGKVSETFFTVSPITTTDPVANKIYCNGDIVPEIKFTSPSKEVVYSWTNSNPTIGISASGEGNILSFTATNTTLLPQVSTINVEATTTRFGSDYAYISNSAISGSVSVYNIATNTIEGTTIPVGLTPNGIRVGRDNKRVFVCNMNGNSVSVIDTQTNAVITTVPVGDGPLSSDVNMDNSKLYVMNVGSKNITVVNLTTYDVISTIPLGEEPKDIEFSPDGSVFYVSVGDDIWVFNIATNAIITKIKLSAPLGYNAHPVGLKISPDGTRLYASNFGLENLSVISTITNTVIANIPVNVNVYAIAINSDGSRLYVASASEDTIEVINTATNTIIATIPSGDKQPNGITVSADDARVYAINNGDFPASITIINAETNTVVSRVSLPNGAGFILGDFIKLTPKKCLGPSTSFTITVNPNSTIPAFDMIPPFCSGTAAPILPATSLNGIKGSWSPAVVSTTVEQTYTFTADPGQCASTVPVTLKTTILPAGIIPLFDVIAPFCSGTVAPILPATSLNGIKGSWSPAVVSTTLEQTYTFTADPGQCASTVPVTLKTTILPAGIIPLFDVIAPFCSGTVAPILPATSLNGIKGSWSPNVINNTTPQIYTFTADKGQCATDLQITSTIEEGSLIPDFDPVSSICFGKTAPLLPTTSRNGIRGSWLPAIIDNKNSAVYTFTADPGQCAVTTPVSLTIEVDDIVTPIFDPLPPFCAGRTAPVLSSISINGIEGNWNPAIVDNTTSQEYTFTPGTDYCANSVIIKTIVYDTDLKKIEYIVSEEGTENATITIMTKRPEDYFYQLNAEPIQTNPVFNRVTSGIHSVTVYDRNNCASPFTIENIMILNYPKFFSPNNDGYNDYWSIEGFNDIKNIKINIYDRYGKFLKQLSGSSMGWDGKYNERQLPATDYWFTFQYEEIPNKVVRGHFSLIR